MKNEDKTKAQLINELAEMRQRVVELQEAKEGAHRRTLFMVDLEVVQKQLPSFVRK